jgi:phosphoribosylamine---glycine ligase
MNILVLGSGGREHALIWKLRESQLSDEVFCVPGNAGIAQEGECLQADVSDPMALLELAQKIKADLTVVGPEAPLAAGVVDTFAKAGLAIIGPTKAAARLESSKSFAKQFMQRHAIPTARFAVVDTFDHAISLLPEFGSPVVIKADGLAAGKGVVVAHNREEAEKALDEFMRQKLLGPAGERVVIEEALTGEELSFIVMTDGRGILPFAPTQDHKAVFDNDEGPNTGGMGAYSDDSILDDRQRTDILRRIVVPTLAGMEAEGAPFRGFLYCGLMLTEDGPQVLEYNVRLGDPETQPTLVRLRSDLVELFKVLHEGQLAGLEAHWSPSPAVCVVLTSKGYPGRPETGKQITGHEAAESLGGVKLFHAGTEFHDGHLLTAGGRVMGVTAIAEDLPAAIDRAYAAVSKIQFEGMHYRRDIGARARGRQAYGSGGPRKPRSDSRLPGSAKL